MATVFNNLGERLADLNLTPQRTARIREKVDAALIGQETRLNPWVYVIFSGVNLRANVYVRRDGSDYAVLHIVAGENDFDVLVRA